MTPPKYICGSTHKITHNAVLLLHSDVQLPVVVESDIQDIDCCIPTASTYMINVIDSDYDGRIL